MALTTFRAQRGTPAKRNIKAIFSVHLTRALSSRRTSSEIKNHAQVSRLIIGAISIAIAASMIVCSASAQGTGSAAKRADTSADVKVANNEWAAVSNERGPSASSSNKISKS